MRRLGVLVLVIAYGVVPGQAQPVVERAPAASAYVGAALCTEAGLGRGATLTRAASGTLAEPVRVEFVRCEDDGYSYRFETSRQRGTGSVSLFNTPSVLLADLDFDGHADLWVTGYPDGQGRVRTSDVWLYRPERSAFVLDTAYSALPNLAVSAEAQILLAGIANAGCAASCWHFTQYAVDGTGLVPLSHVEQDRLEDDSYVYREYAWQDGVRTLTFESRAAGPGDLEYPEAEAIEFLDLDAFAFR